MSYHHRISQRDKGTSIGFGAEVRTTEDKKMWKDPETSDEWKINNLELLKSRLKGWQLEAFNKSYAFKKETGISLIKQKLLQQKK